MSDKKSNADKKLEGHPNKKRLNNEQEVDYFPAQMPKEFTGRKLTTDEARGIMANARDEWTRLEQGLTDANMFSFASEFQFAQLCFIRAIIRHLWFKVMANTDFSQTKVTIDGAGQEHTEMKEDVWSGLLRKYTTIEITLCKALNLTPSKLEGRISFKKPNSEDDLLE